MYIKRTIKILGKKYNFRFSMDAKSIFLVLLCVSIIVNCIHASRRVAKIVKIKKIIPFYFPGYKFSGLEEILKGISYIGYCTDKDISLKANASEFSHAQFMVAPAILDTDYRKYEFVIVNCSSDEIALKKIREMKAIPFKRNKFGIILARKLI